MEGAKCGVAEEQLFGVPVTQVPVPLAGPWDGSRCHNLPPIAGAQSLLRGEQLQDLCPYRPRSSIPESPNGSMSRQIR